MVFKISSTAVLNLTALSQEITVVMETVRSLHIPQNRDLMENISGAAKLVGL